MVCVSPTVRRSTFAFCITRCCFQVAYAPRSIAGGLGLNQILMNSGATYSDKSFGRKVRQVLLGEENRSMQGTLISDVIHAVAAQHKQC